MDRRVLVNCPHVLGNLCFIGRMVPGCFLDEIQSYPDMQYTVASHFFCLRGIYNFLQKLSHSTLSIKSSKDLVHFLCIPQIQTVIYSYKQYSTFTRIYFQNVKKNNQQWGVVIQSS